MIARLAYIASLVVLIAIGVWVAWETVDAYDRSVELVTPHTVFARRSDCVANYSEKSDCGGR